MWRNTEVQEFVDWMRDHNADKLPRERVSFNGLDLYSMGASTRAVVEYLEQVCIFVFPSLYSAILASHALAYALA